MNKTSNIVSRLGHCLHLRTSTCLYIAACKTFFLFFLSLSHTLSLSSLNCSPKRITMSKPIRAMHGIELNVCGRNALKVSSKDASSKTKGKLGGLYFLEFINSMFVIIITIAVQQ